MSDDPNANARFDVGRTVALTCAIAAVAVASAVVFTALYMAVAGRDLPSFVRDLLIASITFLFTGGATLVRDFITGGKA